MARFLLFRIPKGDLRFDLLSKSIPATPVVIGAVASSATLCPFKMLDILALALIVKVKTSTLGTPLLAGLTFTRMES